jgi:hypothetical protein
MGNFMGNYSKCSNTSQYTTWKFGYQILM